MKYIDTNIILRYLLHDEETLYNQAKEILLTNENLFVLNEVITEAVYVLLKVYGIEKQKIYKVLSDFIHSENVILYNKDVILKAFQSFLKQTLISLTAFYVLSEVINQTQ